MQGFCDIDTSGGSVRYGRFGTFGRLGSGGSVRAVRAVADNTLTIKQKSTLPVSKTRQDKPSFRSLSDTYLPPVQPVAQRAAATTAACVPAASVTDATARCEPIPAFPLLPEQSTCTAWPSAAPVADRCEPIPAFPLLPETPTCPAWPSVAPTAARCEPLSPKTAHTCIA